jgi:hypothetical protein
MRFFGGVHTVLFWLCLLGSGLFALFGASHDLYPPFGLLVVLAAGGLGFVAPAMACALGLIALPLGGNRPGTSQAFLSTLAAASIFLGMVARGWFTRHDRLSRISSEEIRNPLIFLATLYCFFSVASLISVPFIHVIDDLRNSTGADSVEAVALSFYSLVFTSEHTFTYSFLSVYYTSLAYLLGIAIYRICMSDRTRKPTLLVAAAFLGLLLSLIIGVLDYYGFIDLMWLRGLDPIVNPGGKQFRLQSLFAHSGWYAEYLTLAIPTSLVILALKVPFWIRATAILVALGLGEFVLILTYQRGGWLSYPLTLVAVWAAIYVVRLLERKETDIGRALRRSLLKVLISLPITVVVSLLLVFLIQGKSSVTDAMSPYVSRFKDIQRTGDRTDFFKAGFLIGSLHPVLGGGADSFAWQFEREIESPRGSFPGRFVLPLHGSAHNVYAQTFSGKGLCGLLTLLAIPLFALAATPGVLRNPGRSISDKLIMLTGACYACAFLIYGNVQEVFYIQVLQLLFFALLGIVASVAYQGTELTARSLLVPPSVCVAFVALHIVWEFITPGYTRAFYAEKRQFGCFAEEDSSESSSYRWCGERARFEQVLLPGAGAVIVVVEAGPIPQTLVLGDEGREPLEIKLAPGEKRIVSVPISEASQAERRATIQCEASSSFIPKLVWPTSDDTRRLAFKVYQGSALPE